MEPSPHVPSPLAPSLLLRRCLSVCLSPGSLLVEIRPLRWREAKELLEEALALRDEGLQEYMAGLQVR